MDDQISRTILENFDVTSVDNTQHEIHKISGPGVLKGIENGSLHFITVPTRESEFIDHSLLNPEYITTHIANGGFIIDLMENPDGSNDHTQPSQFISETITNDLQYPSNDEHDRRLTATFFQLVKANGRVTGGETQVIVTNKDVVNGLTDVDDTVKTDSLDGHNFLAIEDQHTLQQTLLNDGHFKIFQTTTSSASSSSAAQQIQLNSPPLPQLTPIRRLSRPRKNSITANTVVETVQNVKTNDEIESNRYQRPMTKKVLPHKKRITKKLKAIDRIEPQQVIVSPSQQQHHQTQQIEFYHQTDEHVQNDESINLNASHFACQICGLGFSSQLDFFSHLKEHYEPIKADNDQNIVPKEQPIEIISKKEEPTTYTTQELHEVDLQFTGFDEDVSLDDHQHQQQQQQQQQQHHHHQQQQHLDQNHQQTSHFHHTQYHQQQIHEHHIHHTSKMDDLPTEVLNLEHKIIETISSVPTDTHTSNNMSSTLSNLMVNTSNSILIQSHQPDLQQHLQVHRHPQHHLQSQHQQQQQQQHHHHHHHIHQGGDESLQSIGTTLSPNGMSTSSPKGIVLIPQDEVEFSDTEDMLEGIRGVVDKVQESVDDTGDEMDMISPSRLTWYANSALNGEMNFKAPRLQNLNSTVDNYQIFFKNDINAKQEDDEDDLQHAQLQHNQQDEQSENDLINSVIADESITEHTNEITEMELNENSVLATLPMPMPIADDDGQMSIKSENYYSNGENTSEYSPSVEFATKKMKSTKKRRSKRKKRVSKSSSVVVTAAAATATATVALTTTTTTPKPQQQNLSGGVVAPRPRGRPAKVKKEILVPLIASVPDIPILPPVVLPDIPTIPPDMAIPKDCLQEVIQQVGDGNFDDDIDDDEVPDEDYEINDNEEIDDDNDDDDDDDEEDADEECNDDGKPKKTRKKYICQKCNKVFNSINALKYHDFSHTGERPHQCDVCGKSFFALNALRAHLRVHSGEKPFNCEECGRAFRQWGDLTYHKISLHSNEKNFQCEFCGKAFARKYSLVIHRRIHTQERNYKCEFCPKTFRASSYLQNHRKIHTGEKPYICETCDKKFRVCGDLKRHQKIHDREKKLATHLNEIIKTEYTIKELNPIDDIESEINNQDKENETVTTYYYTETNINNLLKTDSNGVSDVIIISEGDKAPSTLLTTSTPATIAHKPATNKKSRKLKAKKK